MKHCVLIVPKFFNIADAMQRRLSELGYSVTLLYDRPYDSFAYHALSKLIPKIAEKIAQPYYFRVLREIAEIDYLIVVNGQTLSKKVLEFICKKYEPCRKVLYMWDSVDNRPTVLEKRSLFDNIFSFDPGSCVQHDLKFLPLFYFPSPEKTFALSKYANKIVAIGSHHADRFKIFSSLANKHNDIFFSHLFLKSRLQFFLLKIFKSELQGASIKDFNFTPLSGTAIDEVTNKNDVILDVHHPNQTGLTLRAIDALGKNMKIATTNYAILKYNACCAENIIILDRSNPDIPLHFVEQERSDNVSTEDLAKLSFNYWFDVIMGKVPYKITDYTLYDLSELV